MLWDRIASSSSSSSSRGKMRHLGRLLRQERDNQQHKKRDGDRSGQNVITNNRNEAREENEVQPNPDEMTDSWSTVTRSAEERSRPQMRNTSQIDLPPSNRIGRNSPSPPPPGHLMILSSVQTPPRTTVLSRTRARGSIKQTHVDQYLESTGLYRYVPAPDNLDTAARGLNPVATPEWEARWEPSELESICIESHNASCMICSEDFVAPHRALRDNETDYLAILQDELAPEPLRQLPCRHAFHRSCIENLLRNESDRCPVCRRHVLPQITS